MDTHYVFFVEVNFVLLYSYYYTCIDFYPSDLIAGETYVISVATVNELTGVVPDEEFSTIAATMRVTVPGGSPDSTVVTIAVTISVVIVFIIIATILVVLFLVWYVDISLCTSF